jgi:hypothetical protein
VGHTSRSGGLLLLVASRVRVSHRIGYVGIKLKMDGSMRRATSDPATLRGIVVF